MALQFNNPNIVTDGLFINLDASESIYLTEVEVLVVGGGGGGAGRHGGAGGGGGVVYTTSFPVTPGVGIGATIGQGGTTSINTAGNGGDSYFGSIRARGGSRGRTYGPGDSESQGGSGGGGSGSSPDARAGNPGTDGQGYRGGRGSEDTEASGGGGGAGGPGLDAVGKNGGDGGPGLVFAISGRMKGYGGGGGGCASGSTLYGRPGRAIHGGGQGSIPGDGLVRNGTNGTGGGGGGQRTINSSSVGGTGGSGIVIVRYPGPQKATGGNTIETVGGYTIHTFTTDGTFTPSNSTVYGWGNSNLNNTNSYATFVNGPSYSSTGGSYIDFNGLNSQYASIANNSIFQTNIFTLDMWIYFKDYGAGDITTFGVGSGSYAQWYFRMYSTTTQWTVQGTNSGLYYDQADSGSTRDSLYPLNTWLHICMPTDTEGGDVKLYINGDLQRTLTTSSTIVKSSWTPANLHIGGFNWDGYTNTRFGSYRFYNRKLSASEILQNYNATKTRFGL
jgi:hypothetical protein